jgi:hypothetical protein
MQKFTKFLCLALILLSTIITNAQEFDGYALFNRGNDNTTYLIDKNGDIAHTWSMDRPCNYAVLLMENGNIMRGAINQGNDLNGAAVGGMVQEITPQGDVVWEFVYSNEDHVSHHDITLMPDGNVLLTAWEVKNSTALDAAGYTGNSNVRWPTHFVEVSQIGDSSEGEIVWEWHIWDHLIQDIDETKPNFGVVSEHPELMNINVTTGGGGGPGGGGGGNSGDWFHVNGVNYNAERDQICFSSRFLSEVFIIDHSTTTEEAAGHTGGNAGKGGDFLYRWGNPANYGANGAQQLAGPVHDSRFIPDDGRPRGGFMQFFNNTGINGTSTVDAIELPLSADGYNYDMNADGTFGPDEVTYRHFCEDNANGQSASNSMSNGNVFVNLSQGYMYEADLEGNVIWQYVADSQKAFRYECAHPGVQVLTNTGVIEAQCDAVNSTNEIAAESIKISPNPSTGIFKINGISNEFSLEKITVTDLLGRTIQTLNPVQSIDLAEQAKGLYFLNLYFAEAGVVTKKVIIE